MQWLKSPAGDVYADSGRSIMTHWSALAGIRREYGDFSLNDEDLPDFPLLQFKRWFSEVLNTEVNDPTAMLLSTVDEQGHPDSRVVLLKGIEKGGFVFYTNYQSIKAKQIQHTPWVALNFYWPSMVRQVRIRGRIRKVTEAQSNAYFASRPKTSQFSAVISQQSREVASRTELENALNEIIASHQQEQVIRPDYWGGYTVIPEQYEFWQGRDNRLHDRIQYYRDQGKWCHRRLAP
jgi:pyridoxamine 5'-phosphate oxidase